MGKKFKAVLINEKNQDYLAKRFNIEVDLIKSMTGTWLIRPFGDESFPPEFLNETGFGKLFVKTGLDLGNGFIEIERV